MMRARKPDLLPSPVVEYWRCRGCKALVGVTREAIEARDAMNAQLRRKGEAELVTDKIARCEACRVHDEGLAAMQQEARQAVRRQPEQLGMQLEEPERASGMQTKKSTTTRRRKAS